MLESYFKDIVHDLNVESERIKKFYSTHNPSGGMNRESLVARLLVEQLMPFVGVQTGLIYSSDDQYSNQADIILTDSRYNPPLHGTRPVPLWLIESVYAVVEVKTNFNVSEIKDVVKKCQKFKRMKREFAAQDDTKNKDSLFCIWAFNSPTVETFRKNFELAIKDIPQNEHPDIIVVPNKFIMLGGTYIETSTIGQPNSPHRRKMLAAVGNDETKLVVPRFNIMATPTHALFSFIYWINTWIISAGPRRPDIVKYYKFDE